MSTATTPFAFGENWKSFSRLVTDDRIITAETALKQLFPNDELRDRDVIDIGCGSGLSMVAALRLGTRSVMGIDVDENSVLTSRDVLATHCQGRDWSA